MIICSCTVISSADIHRAIAWMRAADPEAIITPGKVYRALGKRPDCGGCISLFLATMRADRHTAVPLGARAGVPVLHLPLAEGDRRAGRPNRCRLPHPCASAGADDSKPAPAAQPADG